MTRLFFGLWPDPAWAARLLALAQPRLSGGKGRLVASVDLHVTLSFLGEVEAPVRRGLVERAAAIAAAPFELLFDGLEYWPQSRILAATCVHVPEPGRRLVVALCAAARELGLEPAIETWRPHVTLLRSLAAEDASAASGAGPVTMPGLPLNAQCFYLAQSHELEAHTAASPQMSRYERIGGWPLRRASAQI